MQIIVAQLGLYDTHLMAIALRAANTRMWNTDYDNVKGEGIAILHLGIQHVNSM
jgi:hypothetical protein